MALGGCGQICKWIIILFNILFVLVGLALLFGGVYLRFSTGLPQDLDTSSFVIIVGLSMAIGAVIIMTAVVGDYGSCSENKSSLGVYCTLVSLLATMAVGGGAVAYVKNQQFSGYIGEFYATIYGQYLIRDDVIRAFILKLFHDAFDCCGLGGAMQTVMGKTNICPQETKILGFSVSTSSSCLSLITGHLEATSVLTFFMIIAGVLILVTVCGGFMYQQVSRPVSVTPPYIPLSSNPGSPSSFTICSTIPPSSPPSYTTVA